MSSKFKEFQDLHHSTELFLLANAWNAKSASMFQEKKFPAIATSSAAVANTLGYGDGEEMPFNDYLFVISRIAASVQIPLSVDIETGYGRSDDEIYANILKLIELGVVGINIEDSVIQKTGRQLKDAKAFAKTIENIKKRLASQHLDLFINIRCDTFILNVPDKLRETKDRLKIYEGTGADGIFLPFIAEENDISEAVNSTKLPINVMCIPALPGFDKLNQLGVKRVSMGPFMFNKIYESIGQFSEAIITGKSFAPILS